jgi:mono/diheme cytochrome c family protein
MWQTNLKILLIVICTLGLYTLVANSIPQVASEVPEQLTLGANVTPEQLVSAGEQLFNGAGGCTACHGLGTRAPNLLTDHAGEGTIGQRCGTREPGVVCKSYIYESITDPPKYVVKGFTPMVFNAKAFSDAQIWSLVAFLESNGGTVDVQGSDIEQTGDAGAAATGVAMGPGGGPAGAASATLDPRELIKTSMCVGCHALDGAGPPVGPSFDHIGAQLTADEIRRKILDPASMTAKGFENMKGVMPATFGQQLTGAQLEAIVSFLAARK